MAGRGAVEGAAYGAAHGFGAGEGVDDRLGRAGQGALIGAAAGGATGAVAGKMAQSAARKTAEAAVPSVDDLKAASGRAYEAASNAGVAVKAQVYDDAVDDIVAGARKLGLRPYLHPKAQGALDDLVAAKGQPQTLDDLDLLRRSLREASKSPDDERRVAGGLIDKLDDFVENLRPADVASGANVEAATAALKEARGLWARAKTGELIEDMIERAQTRSSQFSGSGFENALRTEFRNLAMSEKKMRALPEEVQTAVMRVARGGALENALRMLGKFAPTGVVSTVLSGGAGAAIGGGPGAILLPLLGGAARQGATSLTNQNAQAASAVARAGGPLSGVPALTARGNALLSVIPAEAQQGENALNAVRRSR
jgi:hypothetical protein